MSVLPACYCQAWGLRIRSEIAIPGSAPLDLGSPVDLAVIVDARPLAGPVREDEPYRVGRTGFEFIVPGVARYQYEPECTVLVDPAPDARPQDVSAYLIATALPAVLWARGALVLHAAAAILPGTQRAIATLGRSGSGKSRLLARAVALGGAVVADDSICVRIGKGGVQISGLPGGYFDPLTARDVRNFHPVDPSQQRRHAQLGALILLDQSAGAAERLNGVAAATALLAHRHRPRIAQLMRNEANTFQMVAQLCCDIPLYRVAPP